MVADRGKKKKKNESTNKTFFKKKEKLHNKTKSETTHKIATKGLQAKQINISMFLKPIWVIKHTKKVRTFLRQCKEERCVTPCYKK